jgi:uncharacterized membrane protein
MLITIPAGAFLLTLIFDLVHMATGDPTWWLATRPVLAVGVIGGLVAAIPGLIDLATVVPAGEPRRVGLFHMAFNLGVVVVFAMNAWLRWTFDGDVTNMGSRTPGIALTILGAALLVVSGWLGWTLVQTWHVGVLEEHERDRPASHRAGDLPAETTIPPMPAGRGD